MIQKTLKSKPTLDEAAIQKMKFQTPYFVLDKNTLLHSIKLFKNSFGKVDIYYAMKANSEPEVLKFINEHGLGFEAASSYELRLLKKIDVSPHKIIYGTSVKPIEHIKEFVKFGVDRFAFDS